LGTSPDLKYYNSALQKNQGVFHFKIEESTQARQHVFNKTNLFAV